MPTTTTKNQTRTRVHTNEKLEISTGTIVAMSAVPCLVGIWASACFVGAIITSGGPFELARNYFQAITGM